MRRFIWDRLQLYPSWVPHPRRPPRRVFAPRVGEHRSPSQGTKSRGHRPRRESPRTPVRQITHSRRRTAGMEMIGSRTAAARGRYYVVRYLCRGIRNSDSRAGLRGASGAYAHALDYRGRCCAGRHRDPVRCKGHTPERFRRLTGLPESDPLLPRQSREALAAAPIPMNEARSRVLSWRPKACAARRRPRRPQDPEAVGCAPLNQRQAAKRRVESA